ncbi:MarR family winged helix-turn-helix transcriptional regulator [Amycolatopsis sp. H20-H5]|uniref:MarR family winged helix-turn-helix transcriptional regulator n=1 Tax=Amycolatopsis sp. H20-H5 TaxID=3046309 RepID=UPI002DBDAA42|nr:MarR family transcriptional regulator [Amycolatopsis sp. H20-H5]MEC3982671.1 MarR family transcriptional regulator [Amycolatopsis sp. H20-H5]
MPRTKSATVAWESLFRAQVTLGRRLNRAARGSEVSMRVYDVLYNLTRFPEGRLRLHELNEHILLDQSSLSRLVERMESDGLVARAADPQDRRGTVVELTAEGAAVQKRVGRDYAAAIGHYVGGALTGEELRTLQRLCDKLRAGQDGIADQED